MGFYIELKRAPETPYEFAEQGTPQVFWMLYAIAGFALTCMGSAAYLVLGDLAAKGDTFDKVLVGLLIAVVPVYFLIGLKLLAIRKYVAIQDGFLRFGYRLFSQPLWERRIAKESLQSVELMNRKPSQNMAPVIHDNEQYFIRGHWRVVIKNGSNKSYVLDKHTEKGALIPLFKLVRVWSEG